jgi:hypothetical protein
MRGESGGPAGADRKYGLGRELIPKSKHLLSDNPAGGVCYGRQERYEADYRKVKLEAGQFSFLRVLQAVRGLYLESKSFQVFLEAHIG